MEREVPTEDGRTLRVLEQGDPDGRAVLVHNGTPNSRLMYRPDVESAERLGVRLISYDRPGYGGSTAQPGRSVGDCAQDVRAIATALGVEQLGVWGISGGGPHAIACAALLEDLVPAVGVLASPAPWGAPGLDYFAGMGERNADDARQQLKDPVAARERCRRDRTEMLRATAADVFDDLGSLLSPVDAAMMTGELAEYFVEMGRSGLEPGSDGWWDDEMAMLAPWGFEIDSIRTPVLLRHGRADQFVPVGHGEWLARHIPGVQATITEDDGHLTLTHRYLDEIHGWLIDHLS
jgi:pimeloyl-ACP methyl ester carboxylesterase